MARDHPAEGPLRPTLPAAISRRQWLASAVLAVCTALVALAVTAGPDPHQRAPQFLLAGVACSPIALLRRWPLAVLAAATVAKVLLTAKLIDEAGITAGTTLTEAGLTVTLPAGASRELVADINARLVGAGIAVYGLQEIRTSLEDWFLSVTSRLGEPS